MKWNIWKYFLPLSREIVVLLDKQSRLRDFHAVNKLLHDTSSGLPCEHRLTNTD